MQPQPLLAVSDVEATSAWYQEVLGLESAHGGDEYERLTHGGRLVMQLHRWDAHEHQYLGNPDDQPYGNGVLLWFQTDQFDDAVASIKQRDVQILEGPFVNPSANHREIWIRDPNGYVVVIAGMAGDLGLEAGLE